MTQKKENPPKKKVGIRMREADIDRINAVLAHSPRDWTFNRILEEGALLVVEKLEEKYLPKKK